MNKKILTILSGAFVIAAASLLSMAGGMVHPALSLLAGLFLLPPLMLTVLRQYSTPAALWLWAGTGGICILLAPSTSWGILFAVIWLTSAMILRLITDRTIDLFTTLLYGGSLYLGLILLAGALIVKEHYGVFDFAGVFTSLEQALSTAITKISDLYQKYLPAQDFESLYAPLFEQFKANTEGFVYRIFNLILVLLGGWYLFTLKISQNLCRLYHKKIATAPLILYGVPREIAICYIILYVVSMFVGDTYYYAFQIAMTLTGFLLIPAGVGMVDAFMYKRPALLRTTVKTLLLVLSFWGYFFGAGIAHTILMIAGLYVSLSRRVVFRQSKGENKDE